MIWGYFSYWGWAYLLLWIGLSLVGEWSFACYYCSGGILYYSLFNWCSLLVYSFSTFCYYCILTDSSYGIRCETYSWTATSDFWVGRSGGCYVAYGWLGVCWWAVIDWLVVVWWVCYWILGSYWVGCSCYVIIYWMLVGSCTVCYYLIYCLIYYTCEEGCSVITLAYFCYF